MDILLPKDSLRKVQCVELLQNLVSRGSSCRGCTNSRGHFLMKIQWVGCHRVDGRGSQGKGKGKEGPLLGKRGLLPCHRLLLKPEAWKFWGSSRQVNLSAAADSSNLWDNSTDLGIWTHTVKSYLEYCYLVMKFSALGQDLTF